MAQRIEDYALVGDLHTAALIGKDGSVDWLCLPRFDSGACFAALLGEPGHGHWSIAPAGGIRAVHRAYRENSLVLETTFETDDGAVRIVDCMPIRRTHPDLIRIVQGVRGRVQLRMELIIRFDYGSIVPWMRRLDGLLSAIGGPDALCLRTPVETKGKGLTTEAEFAVSEGERIPFVLTYYASHEGPPPARDAELSVVQTESWWRAWCKNAKYQGPWREAVTRSLITLKALTYRPTGAIVAAPTTSLPEQIGGRRNWDYRYCWLRDATFTLYSLLHAGFEDEARAWRNWLSRAVAGSASELQILYGVDGGRRIEEFTLDWLPGYEQSRPVRAGNAAYKQFQLDVYGEVVDAIHQAHRMGIQESADAWSMVTGLVAFVGDHWREPDNGIWEVRGGPRHFTHSKVMAWVAIDRAIKSSERFGLPGPLDEWRRLREAIHDDVCARGYDARRRTFTQYYGTQALDASLLMIPLVGFLPCEDERVRCTIEAVERELMEDGFVKRYSSDGAGVDGLPPGEGAFLPCTFWLADGYTLLGRQAEARALFERLLDCRNDVGLLSEEYDVQARRLVGNFPQAFTHVGLLNTALGLSRAAGPAKHRSEPL